MRKFCVSLIILLSTSFIFSQENNIVSGNLLVMLGSDDDVPLFTKELKEVGGVTTGLKLNKVIAPSMDIYLFDFDNSVINQERMLSSVKNNHLVKIAQFNHEFHQRAIPNDSLFTSMWDMNNTGQTGGMVDADIDAPEAWDITTGGLTAQGDSIVVAVIDDGFDLTHHDLNFWKNNQEIPGDSIDNDGNGYIDDYKGWNGQTNTDAIPIHLHGTHVSGIVGAKGNNGIGITGVNWNVKVMAISYGNASGGTGLESAAIASYAYVRDQRKLYNQTNGAKGAFVVATNSSFGIDNGQPSAYPMWCAMYDSLGAVGILSAAATANNNVNIDLVGDIPTGCTSNWLITVTNTTNTDQKNPYAGYGTTSIDLGAPGTSITSTIPYNTYAGGSTWTGTSMASPHVAGAVALMYSVMCSQFITDYKANPSGIALMVKDSLLNATDPISDLNGVSVSGGRLNLYKSVRAIQNYCSPQSISVIENNAQTTILELLNAYPNPVTNKLNIVYNSYTPIEMILTDVFGSEVKSIKLNDSGNKGLQHCIIDISCLSKGVYFVSAKSSYKKSNVFKVIVD